MDCSAEKNIGVGAAFNEAIKKSQGEIIVLMCADDIFTHDQALWDIVFQFIKFPGCGVVTRWYHQFIDGDPQRRPVRAWRTNNPVIQGNNPSGLAFRRSAIFRDGKLRIGCSNKMFIESAWMVKMVTLDLWGFVVLKYDGIAARVHQSTSTTAGYWLKRRVSSPVLDWYEIGGQEIAKDFTSLIQIKNGFKLSAVMEEIWNFILLSPINLIRPDFWIFSIVAIIVQRPVLRKIPDLYRRTWGRWTTKEKKRPI